MKESSKIEVLSGEKVLRDGFHDEFDALEWLELNHDSGKFIIRTERHIVL